jgi:hypothetical protein
MSDTETKKDKKAWMKDRIAVIIHRLNCDPANQYDPFPLNIVGVFPRTVITPGQPIKLHPDQIQAIKDEVIETEIEIPESSGVYESENPLRLAEQHYPGFSARLNEMSGVITVTQKTPLFAVETQ